MSDQTPKPPKQPYVTPKVVTYGDFTTLTRAASADKGKADGGGKLKTKTAVR